jgi:hypothetical protein
MTIKSLKHSSLTDNIFYRSVLAGNAAYFPEFESDDFLEEVVLTTAASSVTFSGLDAYSDYKHLQIRMIARDSVGATALVANLNSDTGSNYSYHRLFGNGSSVGSGGTASQSYANMGNISGASSAANSFTALVTDVLDFSNSSKNTTLRTFSGGYDFTWVSLYSNAWYNTAAVTSIELQPVGATSLVAGSRFSLYGSKG